jgi:hypothetical protein
MNATSSSLLAVVVTGADFSAAAPGGVDNDAVLSSASDAEAPPSIAPSVANPPATIKSATPTAVRRLLGSLDTSNHPLWGGQSAAVAESRHGNRAWLVVWATTVVIGTRWRSLEPRERILKLGPSPD